MADDANLSNSVTERISNDSGLTGDQFNKKGRLVMDRKTIFFISLSYLFAILILGLLFFVRREWLVFLPATPCFGPIPLAVPWFGALGAVLISLTGVFEHEQDWDKGFWPWHLARPFIGVGLAIVSVLLMQAGILAVGSSPDPQTCVPNNAPINSPASAPSNTPASPPPSGPSNAPIHVPKNLLYYLVAFLVGYREETFRELIKRLVDVVLSPGTGKGPTPTLQVASPSQVSHAAPTPIVISGTGLASTQSVKFGTAVAQFKVDSDVQLTATTPIMSVAGAVPLTVTTKNGSASLQFTFT